MMTQDREQSNEDGTRAALAAMSYVCHREREEFQ
jgi:hypothetical protein